MGILTYFPLETEIMFTAVNKTHLFGNMNSFGKKNNEILPDVSANIKKIGNRMFTLAAKN